MSRLAFTFLVVFERVFQVNFQNINTTTTKLFNNTFVTIETNSTLATDGIGEFPMDKNSTHLGGEIDITHLPLTDLCSLFEIDKVDCFCPNKVIAEVCQLKNIPIVEKIFTCLQDQNMGIGIANTISSVVAILGNGLVIFLTVFNWKSFSRFRHLITALAISDFVFAVVQIFMSIPQTWTCHWVYGLALCKILRSSLAASANIAVGFIVIIAIDRYLGVIYMLSGILSKARLASLVFINIVLGVASCVPTLVVLELGEFTTCAESWGKSSSRIYTWVLFVVYYLLPVISLAIMYSVMIIFLKKDTLKSMVLSDEQQKHRLKRHRNTMSILITILLLFAVLVLPNRIVWIINDQYGLEQFDLKTAKFLRMFSQIPYGFHAAVNPIIYSVLDKKFKEQLASLFKCKSEIQEGSISTKSTSVSCEKPGIEFKEIKKFGS